MNKTKEEIIEALAYFLANHTAAKSVALQVERQRPDTDPRPRFAEDWARLRSVCGLQGYPTIQEVTAHLHAALK